jgi:hypothetical protein
MFAWVKFVNLALTVAEMAMGLFRDAEMKQAGRDSVAAGNAARSIKARNRAYEKIKTFDDAVAAALDRVRKPGDNK